MENKEHRSGTQTPQETDQALSSLADKLEEMDDAEGVFGEAVFDSPSDDVFEDIAGGQWPISPTIGITIVRSVVTPYHK